MMHMSNKFSINAARSPYVYRYIVVVVGYNGLMELARFVFIYIQVTEHYNKPVHSFRSKLWEQRDERMSLGKMGSTFPVD